MNENEGVRPECVDFLNVGINDMWKRISYTFPQKKERKLIAQVIMNTFPPPRQLPYVVILRKTPPPSNVLESPPPSNALEALPQPNPSVLAVIHSEELIIEILSHLSVKSLMQLKSVSKTWKTIISDPLFIKN